MTGPTFSPDGKFMWTGNEWIPAPPVTIQNIAPETEPIIEKIATEYSISNQELSETAIHFDIDQDGSLDYQEIDIAAQSIVAPTPTIIVEPRRLPAFTKVAASILALCLVLGIGFGSWWFFFYDPDSCWKEMYTENDEPPGGVIDSTTTYYYDENFNLILEEEVGINGAILDRTTYSYSSNGYLLEEYRTFGSDWQREIMTYDANGNTLTKRTENSYSWDDSELETNTYSNKNRITTKETDVGIDGVVDTTDTYVYDHSGLNRLEFVYTSGTEESVTTHHYDDHSGRLFEIQIDEGRDGTIDDILMRETYDTKGNLIRSASDFGNDGDYEILSIFTYDDENRLTRLQMMFDYEGTWLDSQYISNYEYDGDLMVKVTLSRFDGDQQLEGTDTTYYGCVE